MANGEKERAPLVELRFTCPECGSSELSHCCGGFVYRKFIEAVACRPLESDSKADRGAMSHDCEIRYAGRPDGTEDCDCVEDNYDVDSLQWFACIGCESVLEFEGGETVENERELVEWLLEHQAEPDNFS